MRIVYIRAMDALHRACLVVAGTCLVALTLIIPWGVFTRYVLGFGSRWPEPLAILLMIWFSFTSAAVCYREFLHIGVLIVPSRLEGTARVALGWLVELCMAATNLFMLWWGTKLVAATWRQSIAEFPVVSVGVSYLPVPIGGAIVVLFVIERLWKAEFFRSPESGTISHVTTQ